MKGLIILIICFVMSPSFAINLNYPIAPDPRLTPGKLCDKPTAYRYPERIPYCERDVLLETKEMIIQNYDHELGYKISSYNRFLFKIDHYIPLCAGGSNDISNLWPQHQSVYLLTDPIEPLVCQKMAEGRLKQKEAIQLIINGKNDFKSITSILMYLNRL